MELDEKEDRRTKKKQKSQRRIIQELVRVTTPSMVSYQTAYGRFQVHRYITVSYAHGAYIDNIHTAQQQLDMRPEFNYTTTLPNDLSSVLLLGRLTTNSQT